ncbi:hypothetical protein [Staphylococcus haemolyticus]|uniref:hypothetical protein n=1 Tax=Staphylococcus haemolyticus TaxID=1283 RepID=UPI0013749998|nr:hypothetical protein [Staphylococcus haemolyticus]MCH4414467.1 hypothetical protein [Staphylococcus haemolyticus]
MKARKMIDELIDIIDELGNVDIRSEDDNDFEFVHYNRHSDYAHVELNEMEDE